MRFSQIIVAMAFGSLAAAVLIAADPPAKEPLEFRKLMTMPAENQNDFRHAVIAVSNEQKSLLSRNLIVTDRADPKATTSGLHLWSFDGEKSKRTSLGDSTTIGFIPKSTLAYSVDWGDGVVLWDTRTHKKIGEPLPHELREDSMPHPAVSPEADVLVTRCQLNQLQFWDLKTSKPITAALPQRDMVWNMEFSADGKYLFSENYPSELKVWAPQTGKLVAGPFRHDVSGYTQVYSPKTQQLLTIENNEEKEPVWSEAVIRSSKDWEVVQRVKLAGLVREVEWIDDTHLLIVGDDKTKPDAKGKLTAAGRNLLHVVTLNGEKSEIQTVLRDARWIGKAGVAPNGQHFIASTSGGDTSCWKLGEPKPIWKKSGSPHFGNGDWVVLTNQGGAIAYSLSEGQELWRQDKVETVKVQGSDIWVFGPKEVDVWRVSSKAK